MKTGKELNTIACAQHDRRRMQLASKELENLELRMIDCANDGLFALCVEVYDLSPLAAEILREHGYHVSQGHDGWKIDWHLG